MYCFNIIPIEQDTFIDHLTILDLMQLGMLGGLR